MHTAHARPRGALPTHEETHHEVPAPWLHQSLCARQDRQAQNLHHYQHGKRVQRHYHGHVHPALRHHEKYD